MIDSTTSKSGFTLLEVMLAAVLAAVVMLPIGVMMATAFNEPVRQSRILDRDAGVTAVLQKLRELIHANKADQIAIGNNAIQFDDDEGLVSKFYKNKNALFYERENMNMAVIEDSVNRFSIVDTNCMLECTLELAAYESSPAITYVVQCAYRN